MTNQPLSPAANAVWEAFNEDEAGVFVDYGDKLAAALRAAANRVLPHSAWGPDERDIPAFYRWQQKMKSRSWILAIAAELEGLQ